MSVRHIMRKPVQVALPAVIQSEPVKKTDHFKKLPQQLIKQIFAFLPDDDFCSNQTVCKQFHVGEYRASLKRSQVLNASNVSKYLRVKNVNKDTENSSISGPIKNGDVGQKSELVVELEKIGAKSKHLQVEGVKFDDLCDLFSSKQENEPAKFPLVERLDISLSFASDMRRRIQKGKVTTSKTDAPSITKDKTDLMLKNVASHCPNLKEVTIRSATGDTGWERIKSLLENTAVRKVYLCECTHGHLSKVIHEAFPNLEISITGVYSIADFENAKPFVLAQLKQLEVYKYLRDKDMTLIPQGHGLESLLMTNCDEVTDEGFVHVERLSKLASLKIQSCEKITNLSCLARMKQLTCLTLVRTGSNISSSLKTLTTNRVLKDLALVECAELTDDHLTNVGQLASLEIFGLEEPTPTCTFTRKGFSMLSQAKKLQKLVVKGKAALGSKWMLNDGAITGLVLNLPKLEVLDLREFSHPAVSPKDIESMCKNDPAANPKLTVLMKRDKVEKKEEGKKD